MNNLVFVIKRKLKLIKTKSFKSSRYSSNYTNTKKLVLFSHVLCVRIENTEMLRFVKQAWQNSRYVTALSKPLYNKNENKKAKPLGGLLELDSFPSPLLATRGEVSTPAT